MARKEWTSLYNDNPHTIQILKEMHASVHIITRHLWLTSASTPRIPFSLFHPTLMPFP